MHILGEIKSMRRRDMDKMERFRLNAEDMKEDAELRKLIIEALAYNVSRILPGGDGAKGSSRADADAQKAAESRQQNERARARDVLRHQQDNQPRDQRQQ